MTHLRARAKPVPTVTGATPFAGDGLLQRKCACGKRAGLAGDCEECQQRKFLGRTPLQKKLDINEPGDRYEQEADRIAEQITNGEVAPRTDRAISNIARVQRSPLSPAATSDVPPIVHEVLSLPGQPLDQNARGFFEPRFGHDFSQVRVHADSKASESAEAVDALAYTVAPHIVFSRDHFSPNSPTGRSLIAHELAHIVQQGFPGHRLQRQEAPPAPELSSWEEGLIETAAAVSTLGMGETTRTMVKAALRGFALEVKAQAPTKGPQVWNKVEEMITSPSEAASFVLHYDWGLVKGLFSPLTGLIDLAAMGLEMPFIQLQILATTWTRREQLANEARTVGEGLQSVGGRLRDAVAGFTSSPIETLKALEPWFASMQKNAEATAESAGHSIGNVLMSQLDRPLPELGEIAGETAGSAFINLVLFIFTDGIGDAISLAAAKLGELGAAIGKFGETAQMLGALAGEIGELLGTIGAWVTKAEAAFAAAAETVLKPIAPLLKEVGKLLEGLRSFLRDLLGVTEGAAGKAVEKAAATTGRTLETRPSPRAAELTTPPAPNPVSEPRLTIEPAAEKSLPPSPPEPALPVGSTAAGEKIGGPPTGTRVSTEPEAPPTVTTMHSTTDPNLPSAEDVSSSFAPSPTTNKAAPAKAADAKTTESPALAAGIEKRAGGEATEAVLATVIGCFAAGTQVHTDQGLKSIELLNVGDRVASLDPKSGKQATQPIARVFVHMVPVVLDIQVGETLITCSPEHPFWVPGSGWQKASTLVPTTPLLSKKREVVRVNLSRHREGTFEVFNIEVDGLHTYHVSDAGILVHNKAMDLKQRAMSLTQEVLRLREEATQLGQANLTRGVEWLDAEATPLSVLGENAKSPYDLTPYLDDIERVETGIGDVDAAIELARRRAVARSERLKKMDTPVQPEDIKGAPPPGHSATPGHARSKHGYTQEMQAEILNNPERIFSGVNENGREVDIYYKEGDVAITVAGQKDSMITTHGINDPRAIREGRKTKAVDPEKWANDPRYVEIRLGQRREVIYPPDRFELADWPEVEP